MDAMNKLRVVQELTHALAMAYQKVAEHEFFNKHERCEMVREVLTDMICRIAKAESEKIDDAENVMPANSKTYKILIHDIIHDLQEYLGILEPHYNFLRMRMEKTTKAAEHIKKTVVKKDKIAPKWGTTPAARLRAYRESIGLTQEQFADKLNRTQARISRMERGADKISRDVAKAIERTFGLDHKELLGLF